MIETLEKLKRAVFQPKPLESVVEELATGLSDHSLELSPPRLVDTGKALLYGRIVNAAYTMVRRNPQDLQPSPHGGEIPDPYQLVAWVQVRVPIFNFWGTTKLCGILVRHREQKRNFVLAFRAALGANEWRSQPMTSLVPFRYAPLSGRVSRSYDTMYSSLRVVKRHMDVEVAPVHEVGAGSFVEQLEQLADTLEEPAVMSLAKERRPRRSFVVTGHGSGAALATLFVMENKEKNKFDISTLCTFGSPRVGNIEFVRQFNQLQLNSWRIVNQQDIVPKCPVRIPFFLEYEHVETLYSFSSAGEVKAHVGCWHSLYTYMHWLDPRIPVVRACRP